MEVRPRDVAGIALLIAVLLVALVWLVVASTGH